MKSEGVITSIITTVLLITLINFLIITLKFNRDGFSVIGLDLENLRVCGISAHGNLECEDIF